MNVEMSTSATLTIENLTYKKYIFTKMFSLFSFYALPSGGELKDAVVHSNPSYFLLNIIEHLFVRIPFTNK